jgi:hypothetical protein
LPPAGRYLRCLTARVPKIHQTLDHQAPVRILKINSNEKRSSPLWLGKLDFSREDFMSLSRSEVSIRRRTLLKAGLAVGGMQVANPFVSRARAPPTS